MESVTIEVVAEENHEECLGIQEQASGEVQVSMEAEVSHYCHLLAIKFRRGVSACNALLVSSVIVFISQSQPLISCTNHTKKLKYTNCRGENKRK